MTSKRSIPLWYAVTILTLGIGWIVWYYKINKDAKTITGHRGWSPGMSVFAVTVGSIVIVPSLVSTWRTWSRVREATDADGMSAGIQFCLCFIPLVSLAYAGYLQSKLNRFAESHRAEAPGAVRA
jgi:hypothetical protein